MMLSDLNFQGRAGRLKQRLARILWIALGGFAVVEWKNLMAFLSKFFADPRLSDPQALMSFLHDSLQAIVDYLLK